MAHDPDRNGLRWLLIALVVGGAGFGGYKLYQRAKSKKLAVLSTCSLLTSVSGGPRKAECALTFQQPPPADLSTAFAVEVSGKTLVAPASLDWEGFRARIRFVRPEPGQPPPVGKPLRFTVPIQLVHQLTPGLGDFLVTVRVLWAGKEIDSAVFNTKGVYNTSS